MKRQQVCDVLYRAPVCVHHSQSDVSASVMPPYFQQSLSCCSCSACKHRGHVTMTHRN